MTEGARQAVKRADLCHRPRVMSKARTKFIERIRKHPDGWDLVKELSQKDG
jgi:hypothetical protein